MSSQRRILFQTLGALPAPQFEQLRFTLNPPPGIAPEGAAAQGNRVAALLSWVEGSTGCGLDRLYEELEQLFPGVLKAGGEAAPGKPEDEPAWLVPYGRNPYFTGREEVLTTLHQQLHEGRTAAISQTQAISGLGGIGKTQTAVEYAYRYCDDYRHVFWIRADTQLELTNSYVAIAQALNLPLKDAENQDETVQYVRLWLSREAGWLLIFDNADHPERVQPFLPREITGHILVTSRAQDFQDLGIVQPLEMTTLSPEEAITFLLTRTRRTDAANPPAQVAELAAELGYLPLALEQAAAYIVTNRVSFGDYLTSYRKQRLKRLEKAKPKLGQYPDSVATTWALNLKEVQTEAPAAAALLNYCAFLHADAIPFNLFTQGATELGEPLATALADAADDPLELYDLLNPLCRYSLVRVEPESQSLSLHCLVQEVIRAELGDEGCQICVEPLFRAMAKLLPAKGKDIEYQDWPALAPLVNHVQDLATHCQQLDIASTEAADVFDAMGAYLLERGQYALADPLLQKALELRRSLLENEHEDIASSLALLAYSCRLTGRYGEAEPLYQEALAMRKRLLGDEHPDVACSLNNLGVLYKNQGRYSEAEPLYQEALAMRKQLLGDEHPDVALSLNNLALFYQQQGFYSEAEPLYQAALAMKKRLLGNEHPDVALGLNNLATLYQQQGRYVDAQPLLIETVNLFRLLLRNEHPHLAGSLNNLARCYRETSDYNRAEELCQEALAIAQVALPTDHQLKGRFLDDFATLRAAQGRTEEARTLYQQALAILEPKLGADHPWTVCCRENLAKLDEGKG